MPPHDSAEAAAFLMHYYFPGFCSVGLPPRSPLILHYRVTSQAYPCHSGPSPALQFSIGPGASRWRFEKVCQPEASEATFSGPRILPQETNVGYFQVQCSIDEAVGRELLLQAPSVGTVRS